MKTNKLFKTFLTVGLVATTLLTGCSSKSSSEPVKIGIPSDATNGGRGLLLLEKAGLIEVDDKAGWTPELKDVTKYKYNIEIVPTQANTLVSTLDDFGAATINGTYAVPAGLKPKKDGLITEVQEVGSDNPFINVIVARTADKDNEDYQKVVKTYQSQLVAEYILEKNSGATVPAFEYDEDYTVDKNFVGDIEGYQSSSDGKKVVLAIAIATLVSKVAGIWTGLACCIGHCYPIFAKFHGGKAVSTMFGFLFSTSIFLFQDASYLLVPATFDTSVAIAIARTTFNTSNTMTEIPALFPRTLPAFVPPRFPDPYWRMSV